MLIILEGPDGSGKTTLARNLEALILRDEPHSRVEVVHRGPPTQHPLDEYLRPLTDYRPGRGEHLILDRWHLGERVYPTLRNRPTLLDPEALRAIEAYLQRLGALVVLCTQYHDEYFRVYRERGEDRELGELPWAEGLYRTASDDTRLRVVNFNWNSPINGDPVRILDAARTRDDVVSDLDAITYSGPRKPRYLLLGDERHRRSEVEYIDPRFYDPAFVPFPRTSGHYLLGALRTTSLSPLGIANACDVDDPLRLWKDLGRPTTVALGRRAQSTCRRLGITDAVVPHPQYVRRFHYARQDEYGSLIRQALQDRGDYGAWPSSLKPRPVRTLTSRSSTGFAVQDDAVRVATV